MARNSAATVTINSVDTAKTFVNATCRNGFTVAYYTATTSFYAGAILSDCVLTNATTLTVTSGDLYNAPLYAEGSPTLSWEVIEYA